MSYTHYWTQTRDFARAEWAKVREDMEALLKDVEHVQGIPLANGMGEPGSSPEISDDGIWFNGVGDDSHETFCLNRKRPPKERGERRGSDFCKTARRPYDLAVTAALCYLCTVPDPVAFTAGSDGNRKDFLEGLAEARRALPRYANILDFPMEILQDDRWCPPWISGTPAGYDVKFCVDGRGYVQRGDNEWFRFETHRSLAQFLRDTQRAVFSKRLWVRFGGGLYDEGMVEPNIWNAAGSLDKKRHARIARAQMKVLDQLFLVEAPSRRSPPPTSAPARCRRSPPTHTTSRTCSRNCRSGRSPCRSTLGTTQPRTGCASRPPS